MNTLLERIKNKTPIFFKKLRNISISIGGSLAALVSINNAMSLNLDPTLISICSYAVAVCAAVAGTSQLTKEQ